MAIHKIKPEFKIGDLVHIEGYVLTSVYDSKPTKIGMIIAGPSYDRSYTYQDWAIIDEPMYDIQFGNERRSSIPQRFLAKVTKEESSNFNSKL